MVDLQILNKWKTGRPAVFEKESSLLDFNMGLCVLTMR